MLSTLWGYWYSDYEKELEQLTKQRRLRHLLHKQIVMSKLKLKPTITIVKTGIHELDKRNIIPASIPVPKFDEVIKIDKSTKKKKH